MTETVEALPPSYLYTVEDIIVPEDDPWKNDTLGRKEQALKLQRILEPIKQPFVMTLTASYGMGKTTFLRCWAQDLKNQEIHSVTFNAWETDYSSDAFSAFVSTVLKQLPDSDAKTKVMKKALQIGAALLRRTPALLAKAATKHIIGEDAAKDLKNLSLSEDDLVGLSESVASEMFDRQDQIQNAVADFKLTLETVVVDDLNGELYIFVDELDRCRPTYAVEVLERIKHIFSVKGAKFVIAIDNDQLQNAIKGVYGADIDAAGYLRKFIDWHHNLFEPSREQYVAYLYENFFKVGTTEFFRTEIHEQFTEIRFRHMLGLLVEAYDLTLRDIDRYFTYLKLVAKDRDVSQASEIEIYLAAFFKCIRPLEYRNIINWIGDSTYNKTPFEEPVENLIEKLSVKLDNGIYQDKERVAYRIGILIAIMSKQGTKNSTPPKICISVETLRRLANFNDQMSYEWLSSVLTTSHFERFPDIKRGLRFLDKIML